MDCSDARLAGALVAVYATSLGVFAVATLVAFGLYLVGGRAQRAPLAVAVVIFMLQVVLYTGLLGGQGASVPVDVGTCQPWARWLTYTFSCALLAWEITRKAGMDTPDALLYVAAIALTLFTGFAASSASTLDDRWAWFGVGFAPYLLGLVLLAFRAPGSLTIFVVVTWSIYPVVLLLGPLFTDVISLAVESWLYLGADLITKIGFEAWAVWGAPLDKVATQ